MVQFIYKYALNKISRPWLIRIGYLIGPVLTILYRGNNFEDPIDNRTYKSFLPYGHDEHQRINALAPHSLSLERHRLLWLYLKQETDFFNELKPQKLLHIAPEQCFYHRFKKMKHIDYITGDINSPLADIKMDLHEIPFQQDSFDIVLCNHVLEHVDDDRKCMREIFRVLKPGGWAIMQVPLNIHKEKTDEDPSVIDPEERKKRFGQYDHVRSYGCDYIERLQKEGFKVKIIDYLHKLGKEKVKRYGLETDESLYVCNKMLSRAPMEGTL